MHVNFLKRVPKRPVNVADFDQCCHVTLFFTQWMARLPLFNVGYLSALTGAPVPLRVKKKFC
jgi:hypothetical protein